MERTQSFLLKYRRYAVLQRGACDSGRCGIGAAGLGNQLSFGGRAKSNGPSMSIKFEGKPPFYLGIAEVASAHALDGSVILRATFSVPELRPKSVPMKFVVAIDVAKALAEQLPIAERMAELQKHQGRWSRCAEHEDDPPTPCGIGTAALV